MIYEVCVDWDATDWSAEPDFSEAYDNISGDLATDTAQYIGWNRGKEREPGNAPAATCDIHLRPGLCAKYSPWTTGVLTGKVRPWLPVRVRAVIGAQTIPVFAGFIAKFSYNPHQDVQSTTLYCTDGLDLLARQMVTQDYRSTTACSDGEAIDEILNASGWSATRRAVDKDGGDSLLRYPRTTRV